MTLQEFYLFLGSVLAAAGGQLFLKLGATKLGRVSTSNVLNHILQIALTPELVTGLTLYALGAILYILLLTRVNLSIAGPAVALVYVFTVLLGYFYLKEAVPLSRVVGLGVIVSGVILVLWQR